ncbi:MAG TPA: SDR family NAD(P)-dependent oxidoreductase, partial [Acidimicrobiia bacterium]|nr:SDR family NAD(P)-dependent oxidoreductase [Acidimicrobiia bacterium]
MTVTDRVAIVTGSGQGIGAGIAETLARAGANVVVNDIFGDKATATAEAIANAGGKAVAVVADVADEAEVTSLVDHTLAEFGRVDILVNNVGIARDAWLAKMSLENWEEVLRVNLTSQFLTTRAVVPH